MRIRTNLSRDEILAWIRKAADRTLAPNEPLVFDLHT